MKPVLKTVLMAVATVIAAQASAQVTFYENENFRGQKFRAERQINNLERTGFRDRASSVIVQGGRWEMCEDVRFNGRCVVVRPGRYASLRLLGLNDPVTSVRAVNRSARINENRYAPAPIPAEVIFYEREDYQGRTFSSEKPVENMNQFGFNDRASSLVVLGDSWEVCADSRFRGQCMVLRPGRYPSLAAMGIGDRISSARVIDSTTQVTDDRYAPAPGAVYDSRRRDEERTFEAHVSSVRAVVGPPNQRCWLEPGQVAQTQNGPNVGGAVLGALLGGVLGHQVGGGVGKDIATVGGAVAGAAMGANVGRNNAGAAAPVADVRRCVDEPNQGRPAFWDVSYTFRGVEHRVQMATEPGATITVNARGEPRT